MKFTAREKEAIALSLEGLKLSAIADAMGISVSMVKLHLRSVLRKSGKRTRIEVAFLLGRRRFRVAKCPNGQLTLRI